MEQEKHTNFFSFEKQYTSHLYIVFTAPQELNTQETLNWWWFDTHRHYRKNWRARERAKRNKNILKTPPPTTTTTTTSTADQTTPSVRPYERLKTQNAFALSLSISHFPNQSDFFVRINVCVFVSSIYVKYRENLSFFHKSYGAHSHRESKR